MFEEINYFDFSEKSILDALETFFNISFLVSEWHDVFYLPVIYILKSAPRE